MKTKKEQLGENSGSVDSSAKKSLILEATYTIFGQSAILLTGSSNSSGKPKKFWKFLRIRTKYLPTLPLNSSIQPF